MKRFQFIWGSLKTHISHRFTQRIICANLCNLPVRQAGLWQYLEVPIIYIIFTGSAHSQNPIADNSFLIEEAYNQEDRIVQHISLFDFTASDEIIYNFTQEWPLFGQKHQMSYTIPLSYSGNALKFDGDASMLNYRYQLVNSENIAFAPRVSLIMPSGGRGKNVIVWSKGGLQGNLPVSIKMSKNTVAHINFAITVSQSQTSKSFKINEWTTASGFSIIWLFHPNFNLLIETLNNSSYLKGEATGSEFNHQETEWIINPGFRNAINFESGLQIVPGMALPVTITGKPAINSILFYISFEHGF